MMPQDDVVLAIARERYLRFAQRAATHLSTDSLNAAAFTLAVYLNSQGDDSCLDAWHEEREAEKNGSAAPASDAEFLAFMHSIGATERCPRRQSRKANW
jgi:hypothetical protein